MPRSQIRQPNIIFPVRFGDRQIFDPQTSKEIRISTQSSTDVFDYHLSPSVRGFGIDDRRIAIAARKEREGEEELEVHSLGI